MKQFRTYLFLIFFVFTLEVFAQPMHPSFPHLDSMPPKSIRIAPLNFIDPNTPTIDVGYEQLFNQKYALQLSVGVITQIRVNEELYPGFRTRGGRIRIEGKQYIKTAFALKQYMSFDLGHLYQIEYNRDFTFGPCDECDNPNDGGYTDTIDIVRNNTILNFKYGITQVFQNGFLIDAYLGFGIKYRRVKHRGRINNNDYYVDDRLALFTTQRNHSGNTFMFSLPLNLKIGYRF